jgi:hypothetical protein
VEEENVMITTDISVEEGHISCEICMSEVPLQEAAIPEAADYFVHYCGLECYEQWKSQNDKPGVRS